jgi:hypothetical protein
VENVKPRWKKSNQGGKLLPLVRLGQRLEIKGKTAMKKINNSNGCTFGSG